MNEELPSSEEGQRRKPNGPTHPPRTWRTCCLAPSLALALILIIVAIASLNNTARRHVSIQPAPGASRKQAFIGFANDYFAIARKADVKSKAAFTVLHDLNAGNAKVEEMHKAFKEAAEANRHAASEYKRLSIPDAVSSKEKLQRSAGVMSEAYNSRGKACDILASWNGDLKDKLTRGKYIEEADRVEGLTRSGLGSFLMAASENGLDRDDLRQLVTEKTLVL